MFYDFPSVCKFCHSRIKIPTFYFVIISLHFFECAAYRKHVLNAIELVVGLVNKILDKKDHLNGKCENTDIITKQIQLAFIMVIVEKAIQNGS